MFCPSAVDSAGEAAERREVRWVGWVGMSKSSAGVAIPGGRVDERVICC